MRVAVDTPSVRVTYADLGPDGQTAVAFTGADLDVPPAIVAGIRDLRDRNSERLKGFDIRIEPRQIEGLLAGLAQAFKEIGRARAVAETVDVLPTRLRRPGADVSYLRSADGEPEMRVTVVDDVRISREDRDQIVATFEDLKPRLKGVRIHVLPKSSATYARDVIRALEEISHEKWQKEVAEPAQAPLTDVEYEELRTLGVDVRGDLVRAEQDLQNERDRLHAAQAVLPSHLRARDLAQAKFEHARTTARAERDRVRALKTKAARAKAEARAEQADEAVAQAQAELTESAQRHGKTARDIKEATAAITAGLTRVARARTDAADVGLHRTKLHQARLSPLARQRQRLAASAERHAVESEEDPAAVEARRVRDRQGAAERRKRADEVYAQQLTDERAAEREAERARRVEVAEYKEDTRTGPRKKMPPALEIDQLVQGPGAGFTIRNDLPTMTPTGFCGNPIDGKAYYFIVTKQSRSSSGYVKWSEVDAAVSRAGIQPRFDVRDWTLKHSANRDDLVLDALRTPARALGEARSPRRIPNAQEQQVLLARSVVMARGVRLPHGAKIQLTREEAETGLPVRIGTFSLEYLWDIERFVEDTFLKDEANADIYVSTEAPTHIGRLKTTAKSRRGLKAPGGLMRPKGLAQKQSVYDSAAMVADLTRVSDRGLHGSPEDVEAYGDKEMLKARGEIEPSESRSAFEKHEAGPQRRGGSTVRARAPRRASTAMSKGDLAHDFAMPGEEGRLRFLRRTTKASTALAQFHALNPFTRRDYVAPVGGPLTQVLAASSPTSPIHPHLASMLAISACVRVNDAIVLDPAHIVAAGSKLSIQCAPKDTSQFFSWIPAVLPRHDEDADCYASDTERDAIAEAARRSPMNYAVFMTYNPVLFETTRQFWVSRRTRSRAPWETLLAQPRMLLDIDVVGRFGAALHLLQWVTVKAPPTDQGRTAVLGNLLNAALQKNALKQLMSGTEGSDRAFVQLWRLGTSLATARQDVIAFVNSPREWLRAFKLQQVDRAVPRLMRTAQIGVPSRKASRLRTTSSADDLRQALYLAMTGAPPVGPTKPEADRTLLRKFQANPPAFIARASSGMVETFAPQPLDATGEFDRETVALLNRVLNAPRPLPRGARSIPDAIDLTETTLGRVPGVIGPPRTDEQRAVLATLQDQIRGIDRALASLPPPPYRSAPLARQGASLDVNRPGIKRGPRLRE